MSTVQPSVAGRPTAPLGTTFVVMVGDEACHVRATGVAAPRARRRRDRATPSRAMLLTDSGA